MSTERHCWLANYQFDSVSYSACRLHVMYTACQCWVSSTGRRLHVTPRRLHVSVECQVLVVVERQREMSLFNKWLSSDQELACHWPVSVELRVKLLITHNLNLHLSLSISTTITSLMMMMMGRRCWLSCSRCRRRWKQQQQQQQHRSTVDNDDNIRPNTTWGNVTTYVWMSTTRRLMSVSDGLSVYLVALITHHTHSKQTSL